MVPTAFSPDLPVTSSCSLREQPGEAITEIVCKVPGLPAGEQLLRVTRGERNGVRESLARASGARPSLPSGVSPQTPAEQGDASEVAAGLSHGAEEELGSVAES